MAFAKDLFPLKIATERLIDKSNLSRLIRRVGLNFFVRIGRTRPNSPKKLWKISSPFPEI